jgi:hypothetical protein
LRCDHLHVRVIEKSSAAGEVDDHRCRRLHHLRRDLRIGEAARCCRTTSRADSFLEAPGLHQGRVLLRCMSRGSGDAGQAGCGLHRDAERKLHMGAGHRIWHIHAGPTSATAAFRHQPQHRLSR